MREGDKIPSLYFMLDNVRWTTFKMPDGDNLWSTELDPNGRCIWGKWHPAQAELHQYDPDLFLLWEKKTELWAIYIWNAFQHPPHRLMGLSGRIGGAREYGPWVIQNLKYYKEKRDKKEKLGQEKYFDDMYKQSDDLYAKEKLEAMEENAYDMKTTGYYDMVGRYQRGENVLGIKNINQKVSKSHGKAFDKIFVNDKRHKIVGRKNLIKKLSNVSRAAQAN